MRTYTVEGQYKSKVILKVKAAGIFDAVKKFQDGYEEEYEIVNPMLIEIDEKTLKELES